MLLEDYEKIKDEINFVGRIFNPTTKHWNLWSGTPFLPLA